MYQPAAYACLWYLGLWCGACLLCQVWCACLRLRCLLAVPSLMCLSAMCLPAVVQCLMAIPTCGGASCLWCQLVVWVRACRTCLSYLPVVRCLPTVVSACYTCVPCLLACSACLDNARVWCLLLVLACCTCLSYPLACSTCSLFLLAAPAYLRCSSTCVYL